MLALTQERDSNKSQLAVITERVEIAFQKASDDSLTTLQEPNLKSMLADLRHDLRDSGDYAVVDANREHVTGENDPVMLALVVLEERLELRAAVKRLWETKVALDTANDELVKTRGDVSILQSEAAANATLVGANESLLVEQTRQAIMSARALLEHALAEERAETDAMISRVRTAVETAVRDERGETTRIVARVREAISSALVTERTVMNGLLAKSKNTNGHVAGRPIFSPAAQRPTMPPGVGIRASSTPRPTAAQRRQQQQQQGQPSSSGRGGQGVSPSKALKPERLFSRGGNDGFDDNNETDGSNTFRSNRIFSRNADSAQPPVLTGDDEGDDDVFDAIVPAPQTVLAPQSTDGGNGSGGDGGNGWSKQVLAPFPTGMDVQQNDALPNAMFTGSFGTSAGSDTSNASEISKRLTLLETHI